jgi:hypothetical protein
MQVVSQRKVEVHSQHTKSTTQPQSGMQTCALSSEVRYIGFPTNGEDKYPSNHPPALGNAVRVMQQSFLL